MSAFSPILVEAIRAMVEVLGDHSAGKRSAEEAAQEFARIARDAQAALDQLHFGMDQSAAQEEFRRRVRERGLPP